MTPEEQSKARQQEITKLLESGDRFARAIAQAAILSNPARYASLKKAFPELFEAAPFAPSEVGRCENCEWWKDHELICDPQKECTNREFFYEDKNSSGASEQSLTYPYYEGGYFATGPRFGCVHFTPRNE